MVWQNVTHKLSHCKQWFFWLSLVAWWNHVRGNGKSEHHFLPCSPSSCPSPSASVLDTAGIAHQSAQGRPNREGLSLFSNYSQTCLHSRTCGCSLDSCAGIWLWQWQLERVIGPPAERVNEWVSCRGHLQRDQER